MLSGEQDESAAPRGNQFALVSWLKEVPKVTRIVAITVFSLTLLCNLPLGIGNYFSGLLTLTPAKTLGKLQIWNPVTGLMLGSNLLTGIISALLLVVVGKWLEPVWGQKEFLRFILIVNVCVGYSIFAIYFVAYVLTRDVNAYFSVISGCGAAITAFTVALKQLIPEHLIGIYGTANVKAKHFTPLCVSLAFVYWIIRLVPASFFLQSLLGAYFGWVYLRFFQVREPSIGDSSEAFAFHTFFPSALQPFVTILSTVTLKLFGTCVKGLRRQSVPDEESQKAAVGGSEDDLERRRQLAMKALNERLKANLGDEDNPDDAE